jgi:hypothetical protein
MTKEALRLALDALECWQRNEDCNEPMSKIMGAIKAALEAKDEPWEQFYPEMGKPYAFEASMYSNDRMKVDPVTGNVSIGTPKQEAKDEPVAWRDAAIRLGEELSSVGPDSYYDMNAKEWLNWAMKQKPRGEHSLPQRTWVGLTNDEVNDFAAGCHLGNSVQGAIYKAEAKLKEKNL